MSREANNKCQGCRVLVSGDGVMALLLSQTWEASVWVVGQAGTWGPCGTLTVYISATVNSWKHPVKTYSLLI